MRRTIFALSMLAVAPVASAITFNFDYEHDTNGFFNAARKNTLEAAGAWLGSRLEDSLTAITPGGVNGFRAYYNNPQTGQFIQKDDLMVPADTLIVYVGAKAMAGNGIAESLPGSYQATGSTGFKDNAMNRGQGGITDGGGNFLGTQTDYSAWGGWMRFDSSESWYADQDVDTVGAITGYDLFSNVIHELGHILGFGSNSYGGGTVWSANVQNHRFTGDSAFAEKGENPLLTTTDNHWANGTQSVFDGSNQESAMDPSINPGQRKYLTDLDFAALEDLGWELTSVPVPGALFLMAGALGVLVTRYRTGQS